MGNGTLAANSCTSLSGREKDMVGNLADAMFISR